MGSVNNFEIKVEEGTGAKSEAKADGTLTVSMAKESIESVESAGSAIAKVSVTEVSVCKFMDAPR